MQSKCILSVCLAKIKKPTYFTIQLILLLFMGPIALFSTVHRSHYTISVNFYLYLQYFQPKVFIFNKISRSQIDLKTSDIQDLQACKLIVELNNGFYGPKGPIKLVG